MAPSSQSLKTKTLILSPSTLAQSPHLPAVVKLINYSYNQSHIHARNGRLLPPDPTTRVQSLTQLPSELEPDGFTMLMLSPNLSQNEHVEGLTTNNEEGVATLIATVSAKPYVPTQLEGGGKIEGKSHLLFKRPPPPDRNGPKGCTGEGTGDEGWLKWEVLAMAVHPSLQSRGLASSLGDQVIAEIKARASLSIARVDGTQASYSGTVDSEGKVGKKGKLMLLLSTMKEINEARYLRMGFVTTAERRLEPGTMGSRDGFSVVEMKRWEKL